MQFHDIIASLPDSIKQGYYQVNDWYLQLQTKNIELDQYFVTVIPYKGKWNN